MELVNPLKITVNLEAGEEVSRSKHGVLHPN